jgi:molybdopterin synthase catalytic subunit
LSLLAIMSHSSDLHRAVLGSAAARVRIQTEDFDVSHELAQLHAADKGVGALCSFVGTVRERLAPSSSPDAAQPALQSLELEHYPGMTEQSIEAMIDAAMQRFDIRAARVIHRVGLLLPLDQIVLVAVSSAHRGSSFQACEFLMDYLKTQAPFWKKESTAQGSKWVDARVSDDQALARWGIDVGNAG